MKFRIALVVWTLLVAYGLLTPGDPLGWGYYFFPQEDKLVHAALFFVEAVLAMLVFRVEMGLPRARSFILVAMAGVAGAGLTEWIQEFVDYRAADIIDFIFDLIGLSAGLLFFHLMEKRNQTLLN